MLIGRYIITMVMGRVDADGDRDFAANVSIKFHTPEEFFLDASPEQVIRQFDPKAYIDVDPDAPGKLPTLLCAFKLTGHSRVDILQITPRGTGHILRQPRRR